MNNPNESSSSTFNPTGAIFTPSTSAPRSFSSAPTPALFNFGGGSMPAAQMSTTTLFGQSNGAASSSTSMLASAFGMSSGMPTASFGYASSSTSSPGFFDGGSSFTNPTSSFVSSQTVFDNSAASSFFPASEPQFGAAATGGGFFGTPSSPITSPSLASGGFTTSAPFMIQSQYVPCLGNAPIINAPVGNAPVSNAPPITPPNIASLLFASSGSYQFETGASSFTTVSSPPAKSSPVQSSPPVNLVTSSPSATFAPPVTSSTFSPDGHRFRAVTPPSQPSGQGMFTGAKSSSMSTGTSLFTPATSTTNEIVPVTAPVTSFAFSSPPSPPASSSMAVISVSQSPVVSTSSAPVTSEVQKIQGCSDINGVLAKTIPLAAAYEEDYNFFADRLAERDILILKQGRQIEDLYNQYAELQATRSYWESQLELIEAQYEHMNREVLIMTESVAKAKTNNWCFGGEVTIDCEKLYDGLIKADGDFNELEDKLDKVATMRTRPTEDESTSKLPTMIQLEKLLLQIEGLDTQRLRIEEMLNKSKA